MLATLVPVTQERRHLITQSIQLLADAFNVSTFQICLHRCISCTCVVVCVCIYVGVSLKLVSSQE